MIEILKALFLGIVQGITEWLPVSSTGHMVIIDSFLRMDVSAACRELFLIVVQLGSILAVIVLYFKELWPSSRKTWIMWAKIAVASVPTGIVGLLFGDYITSRLFNVWVICAALFVYGILFIVIERTRTRQGNVYTVNSIEEISFSKAFFMGCFQTLSLVPGTSRSGSTILGGMLLSVSRPVAAKFSFFMAIPAMVVSSGYKLLKCDFAFNSLEVMVLVSGTLVSFIVSLFVLKALVSFVRSHSFEAFGWYRIALSIVVVVFSLVRG